MSTFWGNDQGLGLAIGGVIALWANCAIAQITPDATLPNNSRVTTQDNIKIIEGGTRAGSNLFHSFEQFSLPTGSTAYFQNAADVHNIISRVTGSSISNIDGIIQANSTANLFLINPNGIIFGPNASLNIGGSFIASTASSLNFADDIKFSAINPQTTPILTVNVPIGLQFGATAAPIHNQSQASPDGAINIFERPVGLQVQPGKTLALVGGDVTLEGGNLTAASGRIELGSVAGNSLVSLNPTNKGWMLGYEGVQNFQNIQLIQRTINGSKISSIVDGSGKDGGSNIQVQGRTVELIGNLVRLISQTTDVGNGGDLTITTRKLIVRDGAQAITSTIGEGAGGNLTVNAEESVDLIGGFPVPNTNRFISSALASTTFAAGKAGDMTINTVELRIQDGALISVESSGVRPPSLISQQFIPATGQGGNLTVNAQQSIELIGTSANGSPSGLFASTAGSGSAGNLNLITGQLIIHNKAAVTVSSQARKDVTYLTDAGNLGKAGELNVTARSIQLDNQGKLTAETDLGQGGNITLQVQDLLLMRRNSQISTNAGKALAGGDGGNITINARSGFIVAVPGENNDITANAFKGSGGRVQINANGVFGIVPRSREDLARLLRIDDSTTLDPQRLSTSDITAISQTNPTLNGVVNINTPDVDPSQGLINLPVEPSEPKLASGCKAGVAQNQNSFIITGRGGLPPNPREALRSNSVQVDWVTLPEDMGVGEPVSRGAGEPVRKVHRSSQIPKSASPAIVEAQGWIVDANNDIILVANVPNATPDSPLFNSERLPCVPEN
ncbi:filamentous hemagglutinin N-terminal domain-containing protein [Iningainema tapete]|uniref:Filamentous hemagglutinin N-terminal domain-containing protein n=1 Tax=Iningainema tapete BLCC-T55 TaxID=2748662 RepID=A0A8J6XCK8_9CYAN|nr:filamentous hemagglutinin N-terminal domain-containing protein [Iningainema tapete]MBD2770573.1 filamentous hemagglutinin N-terminal domain-containing protein [Iningainema tapete BLCC-T55]